jgi:threonine aldolase
MRQVGYLAAAGIYALENNRERLEEDHRKAKEISVLLNGLPFIKKVEPTETNIVIFEIDERHMSPDDFLDKLNKRDVHIIGMGQNKLRIVTHLDYTDEMHEEFMGILAKL